MAENIGFEPMVHIRIHSLSRGAPLATQSILRYRPLTPSGYHLRQQRPVFSRDVIMGLGQELALPLTGDDLREDNMVFPTRLELVYRQ